MTDWIDFTVYAAFLFALWFAQPAMQQRLAIPLLRDRNAEWVAAHPEAVRAVERSRWRLWLSWSLGSASLAVLASYQLDLWTVPPPPPGAPPLKDWLILWNLAMASMVVALLVGGTIGLVSHLQLKRNVPVAARRQATLERRSIDAYVPRAIRYGTYALVLGNIAAWAIAAALGAHSSPLFWSRAVIMLVLSAFFFAAARATVARRTNVMDRIFGPGFRRWEARYVFSMQLTTPLVGAVRLFEEVDGSILFDTNRALQILLALFITYGLLRMSLLPVDPMARVPASNPATQS